VLQCAKNIYPIFTTRVLKREKTLLGAALLLVCVAVCKDAMMLLEAKSHWSTMQFIAVCCSVLQCVYMYPIFTTRVLQCVAGCVHISDLYYSCVLQCVKTQ